MDGTWGGPDKGAPMVILEDINYDGVIYPSGTECTYLDMDSDGHTYGFIFTVRLLSGKEIKGPHSSFGWMEEEE